MVLSSCTGRTKMTKADVPAPTTPHLAVPQLSPSEDGLHIVRLKNGLTVLIKEDDRFPLVNVRLYVHAGSAYETPEIAGISHLLEHMVFKGTTKRGPGESAREVESVGGDMNAYTSFDNTVYYTEVPAEKWALGMDIVTDMAFNAKVDPADLKSEKQVVLSELDRGEDEPSSKLFKSLQQRVWKGTSYEWPIIGFRESVSPLTAKDIHAYVNRLYQPQSMLLAVVGKVDPQQVLAEAQRLLGDRANTQTVHPPSPIAMAEQGQGPVIEVIPGKWNKVYLGMVLPIPQSGSDETVGLEVLTQIMGGDASSRLYRKFKYERHLVDTISVYPLALERGGMLYIHAVLDADKVDTFWTQLMEELAGFDPDQFTDRELDRAKLNLEDSLFLAKETLSGLAEKLGGFYFFEDGVQSEQNYLLTLSQVSRKELKRLYAKYFRSDKLQVTVLTPEGVAVQADKLTSLVAEKWPAKQAEKQAAQRVDSGETREIALANGCKLVLLPDDTLPYTAMSIYWAGGDGKLSPEQAGLAALVAKALPRGTVTMSATELQDFLADRAASLGASAGRNVFSLEAKYPTRFTDEVLPVIHDTLTAPAWNKDELERAKQDQIAAINRREDQPLGLAFRHLFPYLYKTGPYALLHEGTVAAVAGFTGPDAQGFWARQSMHPFVMAVAGDFDVEKISAFAQGLATALSDSNAGYHFTAPQWGTEHEKVMTLPERNQAHLLQIFPVPGKDDMQATAELNVLKTALAGQSGILFSDLRDKQALGYTVTAMLWQSANTGILALYIGTTPDKMDQALAGFNKVVADLSKTPLPEDSLSRARNILVGDYYQDQQSLLSRSSQAASLMARGFDRNQELEIIHLAEKVSAGDIQQLSKKYLDPAKAYLLKVQP